MSKSNDIDNNIAIFPLSIKNIFQSLVLIKRVFYYVKPFRAPRFLFISLLPSLLQKIILTPSNIDKLQYWVLLDGSGKVIGHTGLYHYKNDPINVVWLGWFCVHQAYRGKKLGNYLLNYTISQALSKNASIIKLYTSDHEEERLAQILYEKNGFLLTSKDEKRKDGITILYREKKIN